MCRCGVGRVRSSIWVRPDLSPVGRVEGRQRDQRLAAGQAELDLGVAGLPGSEPLPITSSRAGHLWDALTRSYDMLGFDAAAGGDEVFRHLVLARIIEPTSKVDSLRVLDETGVVGPSYPTLNRRLPRYAKPRFRQALSAACASTPHWVQPPWCSTTCPRCTSTRCR